MNHLQQWNVVFLIGFVVYFQIRHVFILRTKMEKKAVSRFDRLEKILLAAMFSAGLAPAFALSVHAAARIRGLSLSRSRSLVWRSDDDRLALALLALARRSGPELVR